MKTNVERWSGWEFKNQRQYTSLSLRKWSTWDSHVLRWLEQLANLSAVMYLLEQNKNKLASFEATLVQNSAEWPTDRCRLRAISLAKNRDHKFSDLRCMVWGYYIHAFAFPLFLPLYWSQFVFLSGTVFSVTLSLRRFFEHLGDRVS